MVIPIRAHIREGGVGVIDGRVKHANDNTRAVSRGGFGGKTIPIDGRADQLGAFIGFEPGGSGRGRLPARLLS